MIINVTWTEEQMVAAVEQIVDLEVQTSQAATREDIVKIAVRVAPHAPGFSTWLIDEYDSANDAADWWDAVGKAEWKGEL